MAAPAWQAHGTLPREKPWEKPQTRTFTAWVNGHLKRAYGAKVAPIPTVLTAFHDGLMLINLIHVLFPKIPIPRYNRTPRMQAQKLDNLAVAFKMIEKSGIKLVGIGAKNVLDGDKTQLLGLIWTLIAEADIKRSLKAAGLSGGSSGSGGAAGAKAGLLSWMQKKTSGYPGVRVTDFSNSLQDGLAFCALVHSFKPEAVNFASLNPANRKGNLELALTLAEKHLGIPQMISADDVLAYPDEKSLMTYAFQYLFHEINNPSTPKVVKVGPSEAELAAQRKAAAELEEQRKRLAALELAKRAEGDALAAERERARAKAEKEAARLARFRAEEEARLRQQQALARQESAEAARLRAQAEAEKRIAAARALEAEKLKEEASRGAAALDAQRRAHEAALARQRAEFAAEQEKLNRERAALASKAAGDEEALRRKQLELLELQRTAEAQRAALLAQQKDSERALALREEALRLEAEKAKRDAERIKSEGLAAVKAKENEMARQRALAEQQAALRRQQEMKSAEALRLHQAATLAQQQEALRRQQYAHHMEAQRRAQMEAQRMAQYQAQLEAQRRAQMAYGRGGMTQTVETYAAGGAPQYRTAPGVHPTGARPPQKMTITINKSGKKAASAPAPVRAKPKAKVMGLVVCKKCKAQNKHALNIRKFKCKGCGRTIRVKM